MSQYCAAAVCLKEFDSVHATVTILKSNKASHFENQAAKCCLFMLHKQDTAQEMFHPVLKPTLSFCFVPLYTV
jgi:hypothetical protein